MNSRFKFVQSVNPQPIATNAVRPKFSKLALATSKFMTIETVNEEKVSDHMQVTQTVTCCTTTTTTTTAVTTMTKVLNEPAARADVDNEEVPCGQKPNILLYESTREENQSDILTDDDTGSLCSSIDSKELEAGIKEISQPTQDTVANMQRIDTQMQQLSFISPSKSDNVTVKSTESLHNMSRQFDQLTVQHSQSEHDKTEENIEKSAKTLFSNSIQTLSSDDTLDREPAQLEHTEEKSDSNSVIVLSDSDTEEADLEPQPSRRNISEEPPRKPSLPSSNDPAVYNLSSIDQSTMQKVNNFFDNAPFIEPVEPMDDSFNSSHISKSTKEDIFIPETTDEESVVDGSIVDSSVHEIQVQKEPERIEDQRHLDVEPNKPDFSDNNIIVDIPVIKSTSDQPRQLIRSQSGVRVTASHSSPINKNSIIGSDGIKRTSSNVVLTPSGFRFNSSNGQVNIAAKININIQIVEDSSEDSSEDNNKPQRKSQAIQSSEECQTNSNSPTIINSNEPDTATTSQPKSQNEPKNTKTPSKSSKSDAVNTPTRTPQTASKLKQFEFVPPKSMTKTKSDTNTNENKENEQNTPKRANKSITSESSENDGFQVDNNIPISPRDQKLLHKVYGNAWKTPDVIRSYSAVKGKPDRIVTNKTPSSLRTNRYSKGFDLFKRKIKTNLDSTRLDDLSEISIIEAPKQVRELKSPEQSMKPPQNTPRSRIKSAKKLFEPEPSQSVLAKKKPSPKSNRKKMETPAQGTSSTTSRPQRSVRRKRIIYSDDDSDKENESGSEDEWSDDSSYSESDANLLTEDESDKEQAPAPKPKSVRKKPATASTSKRPTEKSDKDKLIFLDLSSEEIVQVDENFHGNVAEEDLANITRKFLETDLNDVVKPKKKGRKLFTQQYDDIEEDETQCESETKSVRKKPVEEPSLDIEIPRFTHKLFDSKMFGSPSLNKTPNSKTDIKIDEFKTPSISKILAERKTPFVSAKSKLDSPPKTFDTYGFLKSLDVQASMMLCHPDAKKFRENFKAHREELTKILYKLFNEKVFDSKLDCDIVWNKKLTSTAGRFHGRKKPIKLNGNHRIELSEKVLTSADRLRCTLIHEMCHAATWIFDNDRGHGARWKSWARKANIAFPELPSISVCHNYDIEYKYTYKCDMCHSKSYSHSKSKKVENIRCSYCHGMISIFLNKKKDGKIVMEPVKAASGFAKFVKEKYKEFKKPGVNHAEVMRQISAQYSTLSQEEKKMY